MINTYSFNGFNLVHNLFLLDSPCGQIKHLQKDDNDDIGSDNDDENTVLVTSVFDFLSWASLQVAFIAL